MSYHSLLDRRHEEARRKTSQPLHEGQGQQQREETASTAQALTPSSHGPVSRRPLAPSACRSYRGGAPVSSAQEGAVIAKTLHVFGKPRCIRAHLHRVVIRRYLFLLWEN